MAQMVLARAFCGSAPAAAPLAMALAQWRSLNTTVVVQGGSSTYVYTPPGSSVSDPAYAHGGGGVEAASSQPLPDSKIMRPSKKAQWLRMSTRHARELESQSQGPGAMLPPGCSMSDPHYSIRDPVYFVDKQ